MADTVTLDPGTGGAVISTDDLGAAGHVQWMKLRDGTDGGTQTIASGNGTNTAALRVTVASDSTGVVAVTDNAGSLTVDAPVGTPAFVRLSDGAAAITTLPVSLATLPALTAGTAAIGKLAANSGVDIGDVDVTSSALPTGASTSAKQPALGTAGSASADVLTVQGIASMTALKVDGSGVTQPVSGTVTANLGTAAVTNAGTFAVQDSEKIADDAAFTVGTTKVLPVGFLADQTSTDSVNEGDIGAARMTLDRKVITTLAPSTDTEGLDVANNIDVDESEDAVKTSAGKLYGWFFYNDGASEVYIKYYNDTVANVVVGTTVPTLTIPIPAGSASNIEWSHGIAFSAAITIAATTAATTADTGAPAANQVVGFSLYK